MDLSPMVWDVRPRGSESGAVGSRDSCRPLQGKISVTGRFLCTAFVVLFEKRAQRSGGRAFGPGHPSRAWQRPPRGPGVAICDALGSWF